MTKSIVLRKSSPFAVGVFWFTSNRRNREKPGTDPKCSPEMQRTPRHGTGRQNGRSAPIIAGTRDGGLAYTE